MTYSSSSSSAWNTYIATWNNKIGTYRASSAAALASVIANGENQMDYPDQSIIPTSVPPHGTIIRIIILPRSTGRWYVASNYQVQRPTQPRQTVKLIPSS